MHMRAHTCVCVCVLRSKREHPSDELKVRASMRAIHLLQRGRLVSKRGAGPGSALELVCCPTVDTHTQHVQGGKVATC